MDFALQPVLLSLAAGLATGAGGLFAIRMRAFSDRVASLSMGFASGVMLLVAFNGLFFEAMALLSHLELIAMFSAGAAIMILLDLILPHIELTARSDIREKSVYRTGTLMAAGIALHNLPEGLVIAAGYSYMPELGLVIAISIMLHNFPEGIVTAIPLKLAGTKSSKIALITLISGLAEPLAALLGVSLLSAIGDGRLIIGSSLALAAGVMTYITADELIPVAHEYGYKHTVSVGLLLGLIFALLIDVLFA